MLYLNKLNADFLLIGLINLTLTSVVFELALEAAIINGTGSFNINNVLYLNPENASDFLNKLAI